MRPAKDTRREKLRRQLSKDVVGELSKRVAELEAELQEAKG